MDINIHPHEKWLLYTDWDTVEDHYRDIGDIRVYVGGGMWVHPCGNYYQQGGRDGFTRDSGEEYCDCLLCNRFRIRCGL